MINEDGENYKSLFNNIQCGIFEYSIIDDKIQFKNINPAGMKMFGYDEKEFWNITYWTMEKLVYSEDIEMVEKIVFKLNKLGDKEDFTYRLARKDGKYIWVSGSLILISRDENEKVYQSSCINIEQFKNAERTLAIEHEKMEIAMSYSNITIWDYDISKKLCIRKDGEINLFGTPNYSTPEEMISSGKIYEESIEDCRKFFKRINDGEQFSQTVLKLKKSSDKSVYVRLSLKRNKLSNYAVGWTEDITKSIMDKQKILDEIDRQEKAKGDNLIAKARFNLMKNVVEKYDADKDVSVGYTGETYDEWCAGLFKSALTNEQKDRLIHMMDRNFAIKNYEDGQETSSEEYQRRLNNGKIIWTRTFIRIYKDITTNNLLLFLYSYDINNDKIMQEILINNRSDFEMLGVIYPEQNIINILYSKSDENVNIDMPYEANLKKYLNKVVQEDCIDSAMESLSMGIVRQHLEKEKSYSVSFPLTESNKPCRKNWSFYYVDNDSSTLIVSRSDITEMFAQQEKQRAIIESALLSAKQASSAKSDFLSRMSHEIRTPMNAILGMCTLAAQAIGNDEEVSECISKIGISGHYLLSLINDILDMSRIESGKMLLHKDIFRVDEFISAINTVIYGQTKDKKIDYEVIVDPNIEEAYIGDAMKLQQIIINILGNAVKFTDENGKITFAIHTGSVKNNMQKLIFTVNDTGCGISEESMERVFEPFEQEDGSITSEYGGTGLGLAICKNLAELMGGTIQCRSIVGVGSEFTVYIPLEISKVSPKPVNREYVFNKMHTLIVDDDIVVCESTAKTLEDIGMIPEWVCSGMEAIEKVQNLHDNHKSYDYILIDWKMPEMDGIETARRIRKIVGPDVTIIIITAYDWVSIEREAKLAGVNMCISKPMFRSTLVSAFQKSLNDKDEDILKKETSYDFQGANILLAEDHPMNAEIARRLLENKNCKIEIAENGLKAMELFTTKPVNYYKAILMDVRMPVMDGLQAAANIRRWNKEDAKTIPIIAMTANAFDEDVEKCRAAGMNAHLSKPIEPELLYHTLKKYIQD